MPFVYTHGFGGNFSGFGMSDGVASNMCWDTLLVVGTVYSGDTTPTHTSDGTLIYNIQFDTSTGLFIAQFGTLGDELLRNTLLFTFEYNGNSVELWWDEVNNYYAGTSIDLANILALEEGTQVCWTYTVSATKLMIYWTDGTSDWVDDNVTAVEWILDNDAFQTDINGDYLYDENGHVLYT